MSAASTSARRSTSCSATACPLLAERSCGASTRFSTRPSDGLSHHALDRRPGDGVRPAPGLADSAARNRMDRLPQHDRRGLLSRRPSQPRRTPRSRSTRCRSSATTARCAMRKTIRVTDMAFDEDVLMDQDRFLTAVLARPEFQRKMTGTELRYRLGAYLRGAGAAERRRAGLARHLPPARDSGLRRRARRRQRVPEFDEAVGHARGRPDRRSTDSISICTRRFSSPAPTIAGGCSTIRRTRWPR